MGEMVDFVGVVWYNKNNIYNRCNGVRDGVEIIIARKDKRWRMES